MLHDFVRHRLWCSIQPYFHLLLLTFGEILWIRLSCMYQKYCYMYMYTCIYMYSVPISNVYIYVHCTCRVQPLFLMRMRRSHYQRDGSPGRLVTHCDCLCVRVYVCMHPSMRKHCKCIHPKQPVIFKGKTSCLNWYMTLQP